MKAVDVLTTVLVIVGGLNWGLVGIADFDLVATLLGSGSILAKVVYTLVGLSAVYQAFAWKSLPQRWSSGHAHSNI